MITQNNINARALVEALGGKFNGREGRVRCPVPGHGQGRGDRNPSLSIGEAPDGKLLVHCKAGCSQENVIEALRQMGAWSSKKEERFERRSEKSQDKKGDNQNEGTPIRTVEYFYPDENNLPFMKIVRHEYESGRKDFYQYYYDGTTWQSGGAKKTGKPSVPYRLNEWKNISETIYFVEGEKGAEFLAKRGFVSSTTIGGANAFDPAVARYYSGKDVVALPDNDSPGRKYIQSVAKALIPVTKSFKIVDLPGLKEAEDIVDWVTKGGTKEQLLKLIASTEFTSVNGVKPDPNLVCMAEVKHEPIEWIWFPYIPRSYVTFIEGDPGIGKSFITLAIASTISKGDILFGATEICKGRVLLFNAEDGVADTLKIRLNEMGADQTKIHAYKYPPSLDDEGKVYFENAIRAVKPEIVFLDPLSAFLGSSIDMYKPNQVRPFMKYLGELAAVNKCAIVIVRHLTKSGRDHAIYRGTGSIDFVGAARSALLVGCDPDDKTNCALIQIKGNAGPRGAAIGYKIDNGKFQWTGKSDLTEGRILSSASADSDNSSAFSEAKEFLAEILASGAQKANEVYEEAGALEIAERTLHRAKKALGIKPFKVGNNWLWRLPDQDVQNSRVGYVAKENEDSQDLRTENLATLPKHGVAPPYCPKSEQESLFEKGVI